MLVINQNTILISGELRDKLKKYGNIKIKLNDSSIKDDIDRLDKKFEDLRDQSRIENKIKSYLNIIHYLENLSYSSREGEIELDFDVVDKVNRIECFPVYTIKVDEPKLGLKLEFADYIEIVNPLSTIIRLNYSEIMRGMVIEICHRDMGISHDMIEDTLAGYGPIMYYDCDKLDDLGMKNTVLYGKRVSVDAIRLGLELKIQDTDYCNFHRHIPLNYFSKECAKDKYYVSSIVSSMQYAMCLIVKYVADLLDRYNAKAKIVAIYDDEIVLNLNKQAELMEELSEPISVKVYGRNFKFPVKVEEVSL